MENTPKSESFDSNVENMEDEGNTVTMLDVLEEQQKWETQAYAVLGASDDKNCSYNKGYVKRQALFSCKTCIENEDKPACICLACSYHCHEGHDLIELYTKRNFRCDCGNSLFKGKKCSLEPNKELNELNSYNHNFRGLYCACERPYPDLEESVPDEMLQCIICEDWFHSRVSNLICH
ncbi:putative E3 ubiquitin-protein ligase UBR7 [Nilaparvata lugens]|uniref:putative E3 ubiquitin-protein ligase UBR7 n=1 Tax=Nilaparvata lugens TaxID=108931 RepID=UPI00193D6B6D|nr:putative E3 ubiquitin-protein ligase UBR7 [Nilaparvata lugens]